MIILINQDLGRNNFLMVGIIFWWILRAEQNCKIRIISLQRYVDTTLRPSIILPSIIAPCSTRNHSFAARDLYIIEHLGAVIIIVFCRWTLDITTIARPLISFSRARIGVLFWKIYNQDVQELAAIKVLLDAQEDSNTHNSNSLLSPGSRIDFYMCQANLSSSLRFVLSVFRLFCLCYGKLRSTGIVIEKSICGWLGQMIFLHHDRRRGQRKPTVTVGTSRIRSLVS